jgi:hypothetical protein
VHSIPGVDDQFLRPEAAPSRAHSQAMLSSPHLRLTDEAFGVR